MKVFRMALDANVAFNVRARNRKEASRRARELADWFREGILVTTGIASLDMRLMFNQNGDPTILEERPE